MWRWNRSEGKKRTDVKKESIIIIHLQNMLSEGKMGTMLTKKQFIIHLENLLE